MTWINVDIRCADVELERLQDGFTGYDHFNFSAILVGNYLKTLDAVHVETGSLKGSGEVEVDRSTDHRWEGHISYGGASLGIKNPVRYAAAELYGTSPKHGGPPSHDYLRHTAHIDDELVGPVSSFISRGRRTPHPESGS